jgi:hypothetical protein
MSARAKISTIGFVDIMPVNPRQRDMPFLGSSSRVRVLQHVQRQSGENVTIKPAADGTNSTGLDPLE